MIRSCPQCLSTEITILRFETKATSFGPFSTSNHIQIYCRDDSCRMVTELADVTHRSQYDDPRVHRLVAGRTRSVVMPERILKVEPNGL